jgi:site-specific recombinase XerD
MPKSTFKEYKKIWLKGYAEMNLKPSTLALYNIILDKHLIPQWGDYQLEGIKTAHIQMYASERLKKVGSKTVRNEIALLKQMFKHAHQWGYVKNNQAEHATRPRIEKNEIEILEPGEIEKMIGHSTDAYRIAFKTAVMTGIRGVNFGDCNGVMLTGTPRRYMSGVHYEVGIFKRLNPKHPFGRLIYPQA